MSIFRRVVCRRFFCSAADVERRPSSPWLMLPPHYIGGGRDMVHNLYSPTKDKVVSFNNRGGREETQLIQNDRTMWVGSSHGWLAFFLSGSREIFLSNPISGRRIALPPYSGEPFRAEEVWCNPWRVILSCSPDEEDCRAVMILGSQDRAAVCRPGRSRRWTPLGRWHDDYMSVHSHNNFRMYSSFVYSAARGSFFGYLSSGLVCTEQEVHEWDVDDPAGPRIVRVNRLGRLERSLCYRLSEEMEVREGFDQLFLTRRHNTYLVPSDDDLFLVRRYFVDEGLVDFNVFRIGDAVQQEVEQCSSLDDLAMFVGINEGFAVKASEFPGLKANCIYTSDVNWYGNGQIVGVFDYQTKTCSPLYYPSLDYKIPMQLPWFTPTLD